MCEDEFGGIEVVFFEIVDEKLGLEAAINDPRLGLCVAAWRYCGVDNVTVCLPLA